MTSSEPDPPNARDAPDIDARGLKCPLPVIQLARRARDLPPDSVITVWADDPAAEADIPAWVRMRAHEVSVEDRGGHTAYRVVLH